MSGETEEQVSGWTVDTLHTHLSREIYLLRVMLDERYATQTKALDAAFVAQQTAVERALTAQERAVAAAQEAAETANQKSDAASEKRFDSVNEFRAQQADIIRTFMPRAEAEASASRVTERLQEISHEAQRWVCRDELNATVDRQSERIQELTNRVNRTEGHGQGAKDNKAAFMAMIAAAVGMLTIVIFVANMMT